MVGKLRCTGSIHTGRVSIDAIAAGEDAAFPELNFLSEKTYVGVNQVQKRACYHFKQDSQEAWIDVQTKLPVASVDDECARLFLRPRTAACVAKGANCQIAALRGDPEPD
jgi:hypothetical protein